ncbi:MAG: hypothetical protein OXF93_22605 [Acidobacteria bacterium]|nr:hypothetical protein [Acidobacteriota bacterium]
MSESMPRFRSTEPAGGSSTASRTLELDAEEQSLEEAVAYVLVDCCFALGQAIGMRTTVDYDAIVWWHDHFRAKFLDAMRCHGNRWMLDRENVTAVGWMLAERAVKHANGRDSIDVAAARLAAADVQRYCALQARRARGADESDADQPRLAGYWCLTYPPYGR